MLAPGKAPAKPHHGQFARAKRRGMAQKPGGIGLDPEADASAAAVGCGDQDAVVSKVRVGRKTIRSIAALARATGRLGVQGLDGQRQHAGGKDELGQNTPARIGSVMKISLA